MVLVQDQRMNKTEKNIYLRRGLLFFNLVCIYIVKEGVYLWNRKGYLCPTNSIIGGRVPRLTP